jgi:hypothetical protein
MIVSPAGGSVVDDARDAVLEFSNREQVLTGVNRWRADIIKCFVHC